MYSRRKIILDRKLKLFKCSLIDLKQDFVGYSPGWYFFACYPEQDFQSELLHVIFADKTHRNEIGNVHCPT